MVQKLKLGSCNTFQISDCASRLNYNENYKIDIKQSQATKKGDNWIITGYHLKNRDN